LTRLVLLVISPGTYDSPTCITAQLQTL